MNRPAQSVLVALFGGLLVKIAVTGRFLDYLTPGFGPLLIIAGAALALIGLLSLVGGIAAELRADGSDGSEDDLEAAEHRTHEHDHSRSRAPWLILVPLLVLVLATPPALGADAVAGAAGSQAVSGTTGRHVHFDPFPAGDEPQLTLQELILRALYDPQRTVSTHSVTVVGFIAYSSDGYPRGYSIARLLITCCAADATPRLVHVDGEPPFPANTWVTAVVRALPGSATETNLYVPTVAVTSIERSVQPADPYLH